MSNDLSYSDLLSLVSNLKMISSQIGELIKEISDDYKSIGLNGDVWAGDVANTAKQIFEDLAVKYHDFNKLNNEYCDYLISLNEKKSQE